MHRGPDENPHAGKALYRHCLPVADITGVRCNEGVVGASVFDRYPVPMHKEAAYKPYSIAARMFPAKMKDPAKVLKAGEARGQNRVF